MSEPYDAAAAGPPEPTDHDPAAEHAAADDARSEAGETVPRADGSADDPVVAADDNADENVDENVDPPTDVAVPSDVRVPSADRDAFGDPGVRAAVDRLDTLSDLPPAEHVEIYESVHRDLQERLAEASRRSAETEHPDGGAPS